MKFTSNATETSAGIPPPLSGIRVIDLTQVYSGPYATFLLAMAGAEVIKVEPPEGEGLRGRGGAAATPFAMFNANKRSVTLDLKSPEGIQQLLKLLRNADVLVENFRPGVLESLSLTPARLKETNPRLIRASLSGFGSSGPYKTFPALDITVQALAGIISSTGHPDEPPLKAGAALADISAGTHLYGAIVTALLLRERTGEVTDVEVSMMDSVYATLASNLGRAMHATSPGFVSRTGNRHGGGTVCPYNLYSTEDGYVAIICINERQWRTLLRQLSLDDLANDPRLQTMSGRVAHMSYIDSRIEQATRAYRKHELFMKLAGAGIPCGAVQELPEVLHDEHFHATGMLQHVEHPEYGPMILPNSPLRFVRAQRVPYRPSARLGEDNAALLGDHEQADVRQSVDKAHQ